MKKKISLNDKIASGRLASSVVGYSPNRLLTTSAATDNTASSTLGFGNLDLPFAFSHSGTDIIRRRTKDAISSGNSFEPSTTKTLQSNDQSPRNGTCRGLCTRHHPLPATSPRVLSSAGMRARDFFAQRLTRQDQREFQQRPQGYQGQPHWRVEPDRRAHSGEASPSWEGHRKCSTIITHKHMSQVSVLCQRGHTIWSPRQIDLVVAIRRSFSS